MSVKERGYDFICDACDRVEVALCRPDGWIKGYFVLEDGWRTLDGSIHICEDCLNLHKSTDPIKRKSVIKHLWSKLIGEKP